MGAGEGQAFLRSARLGCRHLKVMQIELQMTEELNKYTAAWARAPGQAPRPVLRYSATSPPVWSAVPPTLLSSLEVASPPPPSPALERRAAPSAAPPVSRHRGGRGFLGGVAGLCVPRLWKRLAFFSAGFNIWKEHMSVSSTLMMAPALSNSPQ